MIGQALSFILLCFMSFALPGKGDKEYTVFIKQDNQIQMLKRGAFMLNRSAFSFEFRFSEPMGVYVNASYDPASYEAAKSGKELSKIPGFSGAAITFDQQNEDQELLVDPNNYSYYFFQDEDHHSFTGITPSQNQIKCERVISKIIDHQGNETAINNLTQKLYIVIIQKEKNKKSGQLEEVKRSFFTLNF